MRIIAMGHWNRQEEEGVICILGPLFKRHQRLLLLHVICSQLESLLGRVLSDHSLKVHSVTASKLP